MTKRTLARHDDGTEDRLKAEVYSSSRQKIATALSKFLLGVPLEDILHFLKSIGVHYSITGMSYSHHSIDEFVCRIFIQQGRYIKGDHVVNVAEYTGTSRSQIKRAVCNSFADFLINEDHENRDYHDYVAEKSSVEYRIRGINRAISVLEKNAPHMLTEDYMDMSLLTGEKVNESKSEDA